MQSISPRRLPPNAKKKPFQPHSQGLFKDTPSAFPMLSKCSRAILNFRYQKRRLHAHVGNAQCKGVYDDNVPFPFFLLSDRLYV